MGRWAGTEQNLAEEVEAFYIVTAALPRCVHLSKLYGYVNFTLKELKITRVVSR